MKKTILIKAMGLAPIRKGGYIGGIGRSNVALLRSFEKTNDPDIEFELYSQHIRTPFYKGEDWKFKYHRYLVPGKLNNRVCIEPLWRRLVLRYDLLHITGNFGWVSKKENFVVTIHDVFMLAEHSWTKKPFWDSALYSRSIVTCSEYTKEDIVRTFKVPAEKITVIPWGIDLDLFHPRNEREIKAVMNKFGIKGRYFFSCSCSHPRKNAKFILAAFRQFINENNDCTMVLTWSNPPKELTEEYAKEINEGRIKILDFVTDEELATLYSGALASIFVSSFEGFGFPILESMACGTPCVTCRNTSLEEVGSDKAYYVKEKDADAITEAMFYFTKYGKGDKDALTTYAKGYSWDNTARQYIEFYKKNLY